MRKKIIFLSVAVLFFFGNTVMAQNYTKQERKTASFDQIRVNCSADVYLTQGNNQSVVVETEASNQDKILTRVQGNTLVITTKNSSPFQWFHMHTKRLRVYVEIPQIKGLEINGSGDIHAHSINGKNLIISIKGSGDVIVGTLHMDAVQASIIGSGDLNFNGEMSTLKLNVRGSGDSRINNLQCDHADLSIAGSGDVLISGKASTANVMIQGSGDLRGTGFKVSKAITNQIGSGDIHMYVSDNLNLTIKGSGDFYLGGNPQTLNTVIHGSGDLHR